jgi:DNA modification methylase
MISLFCGDCEAIVREISQKEWWKEPFTIITDPPYDIRLPNDFGNWTTGNILTFCKPENQFKEIDPTEYLFWVKTPSTKNFVRSCGRFVEMILVRRTGVFNQLHWSQMTGVYDDRLIYPPQHPYQKPLSLLERLIRIYTNPGDVVLDPYMGSGTTGVACKRTGRNFVGIEKDPEFFKLALSNIQKEVGND